MKNILVNINKIITGTILNKISDFGLNCIRLCRLFHTITRSVSSWLVHWVAVGGKTAGAYQLLNLGSSLQPQLYLLEAYAHLEQSG